MLKPLGGQREAGRENSDAGQFGKKHLAYIHPDTVEADLWPSRTTLNEEQGL